MAKQLNVDMRFTADTSKAKQSITELQQAIQKLGYGSMPKGGLVNAAEFEKASTAARELAYHLNNAYNAKTGNLDLSKLHASLKQSGTSLKDLTANFKNAGSVGQEAFVSLAKSIASADQPSITLNTHLSTMFTTLKNVARFQLSSSIMHGLIGGVQTAFGYAQDLNQSLNNIRIVTGQSTDQMARFAEQANKTARALSATTLDYTNASLIYYQQGLSDAEVKARTDVTVKLANVSRQSAEEVSNQMTAIWNNFDTGAHSMEYFADVITALGATTASSSEEIATGLEKFAPIAGTIGLSYEKATSVLAAIVANTRQSADTVGTGLRTIFSRFESLKLGETLEDGVDLNKYTKAMQTIGVNVLDANGKLRDMDSILDDVAANWEKLDNTQRTAFATTVGGVRQYTNLMALFENWDDVQTNMLTATGAEGTLQKQADIYAESWEAAQKRVKTATQSLYSTLIDEDFFIGIDNAIEHILVGISKFLDGFGGIKSIVLSTLSIILTAVSSKIGPAVKKVIQDIQIMSGGSQKVYGQMQREASSMIREEIASKNADGTNKYNTVQQAELSGANSLLLAKTKLGMVEDKLSASEKMRAQLAIEGLQKQQEEVKKLAEEQVAAEKAAEKARKEAEQVKESEIKKLKAKSEQANKKVSTAETTKQKAEDNLNVADVNRQGTKIFQTSDSLAKRYNFAEDQAALQQWLAELKTLENQAYDSGLAIQEQLIQGIISGEGASSVDISTQLQELFNFDELKIDTNLFENLDSDAATQALMQQKDKVDLLASSLGKVGEYAPEVERALREVATAPTPEKYNEALKQLQEACKDANIPADKLREALKNTGGDSKAFDAYISACQRLKTAQQEAAEAAQELENIEKNGGSTEAMAAAQERLAAANKEAGDAAQATSAALANLQKNANSFNPTHTISALEGITKVAGSFGQINMAINAVKGMITALGDESATAGEKISAVFMGISMGIPAILGAYNSLSTVINGVATALATQGALSEATTAKLMANGVAAQFAGAGYDTQTVAIVKKVAVAQADLFTNEALSTSEGKTAAARAIATAMAEAGIIANTNDAITKTADALATDVLTASNVALKMSMIEIVAIIAAVAAIIAIAVKAIDLMRDSYNKDAIAAENAAKAAEELGKKSEEAAQKAQQIVDTFSKYDQAVEMLSKCEKGTQAWKDALEDVNNIVLDILTTMPELISDMQISRDENGMFVIENTDDIIAQYQAKATNAKAAAVMANISANEASLQSLRTDRRRELQDAGVYGSTQYDWYQPGYDEATNELHENRNRTINNVLDNAQQYLGMTMQEFADALKATGNFSDFTFFDAAGNATEAFQLLYETTMELGVGMEDLQKQMDISAQVLAESYLGDRYSDRAKRFAAQSYQETYDEIYADVMRQSDNYAQSDKQSDLLSNKDSIWHRYLKAIGESTLNYKLISNAIQGEDNEREYVFKVGTSSEEQRISAEQIAATIAAAEALSALEVSARAAEESLGGMQENIDELPPIPTSEEGGEGGEGSGERNYSAEDITGYLATGNFEGSNQAAVEDILADISQFGGEDAYAQTQAYLQSILGDEVGSQIDAQDFYDRLAGLDFSSVGSDLSATARASFDAAIADSDAFKALGIGDQAEAAALFQEMFNGLGAEAVETFGEQFSDLSTEQMKGLTDVLSDFDWSTGDIDALWQSLEQVGITAEDVDLQPFIDYMVEAAAIAGTFSGATQLFKGIQDIIKSMSTGDTISDDDFSKLSSELGVSQELLDQYFITMADGTHKLVGDATAFYAAIKPSMIKQFATNIDTARSSNEKIQAIQSSGYELSDLKKMGGQAGLYGSTYRQDSQGQWYDTTDRDLVSAQLSLLQNAGYATNAGGLGASQLAEWQNTLESGGSFSYEDLVNIANGVDLVSASCENLDEVMEANTATIVQNQMAMATSATTLQELQMLGSQYNLGNEALTAGLQNLGTMYDNAAQELQAYNRALATGNEEAIKFAQANLEAAIAAGEAAAQYDLDPDALEDLTDAYADYYDELSQGEGMLESDAEAAKDAAVRYMRLNRAVEDLSSNLDDYADIVEGVQKAQGKAKAEFLATNKNVKAFKKTMADLLDTSEDLIDSDFVDKMNLDDLKKAAEGDEEAIQRLRDSFIEATAAAEGIDGSKILDELSGFEEGQVFTIDLDTMPFLTSLIQAKLAAGATAPEIQSMLSGFGIDADVSPFVGSMAEMEAAAQNAADGVIVAMDAAAGSGLDANVNTVTSANADTKEDVEFQEEIEWEPKPSEGDKVVKDGEDEATPVEQQLSQARKTITWNPVSETNEVEQTAAAVEIKNAHKSSGGHTGGSSKKTGGGGGGGGNKAKKKDKAKANAGTRYHTVKAKQSNNSNRQSRVNKQKERAFGAQKVKYAQQEIDLQKEQITLQKQYIKEIEKNLKIDKTDLEKAFKNVGFTGSRAGLKLKIDKDGVIQNFQEIEDALLAEENDLITKYNNESWNGWEKLTNKFGEKYESKDEWFEEQKEKLDELRDAISQYEETQDLYEDQLAALQEQLEALADAALELLTTKIQLHIDVDEDELGLLEFMLNAIEDNAYKAAEAISLFGSETGNYLDQIDTYQNGLNELFRSKGLDPSKLNSYSTSELIAKGFTQAEVDQIREWRDAILSANESLLEMRENIINRVISTFEELNDNISTSYDLFDHYNDILENYRDITDTLGRHINKEQKKLINDLNKAMLDNSKTQLATAKELYDNMLKEQEEAKKKYDEAIAAGDEETARQWKQVLDTVNEATNEAQATWMAQWQDTVDKIQEIFETMIEQITQEFDEAISGSFGSLDYLSDAFDRRAETDEQYLQDYDKLYELNKLQRDLNKVLSDTRGVTNRKAMLELQQEITAAQEAGVQLSQYDLDVLRKKFELQNAYNDLQLSKDAKSTVRLQRDREGNWGYVYTANEDAVAEAEQQYEDKLHEYQVLNDEYIKELQEKAIEVQKTYRDTLGEIMSDVTLSDDERQARIDELNAWYLKQQEFFEEQSNHVFENQAGTLERYLNTYKTAIDNLIDTWEETSLADLTGLSSLDDYMNNWINSSGIFLEGLKAALEDRKNQVKEILELSGTSIEDFGDQVSNAITDIGNSSSNTKEEILGLTAVLDEEFNSALAEAVSWEQQYADKIKNATEANIAFADSINQVIAKLSDLSSIESGEYADMRNKYLNHEISEDQWFEWLHQYYRNQIGQRDATSFDTGGYTGMWGNEGRLAFLHEKEQVFNAKDTHNLLMAAQILQTIDLQANKFSNGFGNQFMPTIGSTGTIFEQEVHIIAEFPNAVNHAEIEEAFINLANKATQYANRKNG